MPECTLLQHVCPSTKGAEIYCNDCGADGRSSWCHGFRACLDDCLTLQRHEDACCSKKDSAHNITAPHDALAIQLVCILTFDIKVYRICQYHCHPLNVQRHTRIVLRMDGLHICVHCPVFAADITIETDWSAAFFNG